ncbi:bifunctional acyl-CoA synthetase/GNAT family N-acetyltransferase [Roseomonas nepalensis]|uniref:Bifunctional acyl-CoA synthetase/GNAT family N-acetyltransferase n=1 Tax=Muricoccus nepalensis TaxID=1854500 RepID=A0A502FUC5_9PROT|nr:GNAT family N-acetyltransferase [Roseomonas nepalensis]TPG53158.1 bifunctional acyl-CoA synthetase/GNAT family N-acetyltransferase [Roseomonas nepalensis]
MTLPVPLSDRGLAKGFRDTNLFAPRRVALLADPAVAASGILARNIAAGRFKGALHAVGEAWPGLETVASLAELPAPPDLAVLSLPPEGVAPAMASLAAAGCFAAVVIGPAPGLAAVCAATGVRALGERSFGLCIPLAGLNASLSHVAPRPGRLALLCQSSAVARAVIDWAESEAVGFTLIAGIGTNADYGFAGGLDWLARDAGTGTILLDLRRIKDRRRFISSARAAARTRPVVAQRPGYAGRDGADAVMHAALRRAGVLRVEGLESLLSAAETLGRVKPSPRPGPDGARGDRIAIVSNGLGPAQMAADAALRGGGRLAQIPEAARAMLDLALPGGWTGHNPLALPMGQGHRLGEAATLLGALLEVDSVVAIHAPAPEEDPAIAAEGLVAVAATSGRGQRAAPVLTAWLGQSTAGAQRRALAERGVAVFATPEAAVQGALHLAQDRRNRAAAAELPPAEVMEVAPDRARVAAIFAAVRASGRLSLDEAEALAVFDAYGIPVVPHRVAGTVEEAVAAAEALGWPAVLKLLSADLPAKTEIGGVALGLRDADSLRAAAAEMLAQAAASAPPPALRGWMVQPMGPPGRELRLRLEDDAMFGPWIGFGRGGTAAEIEADESFDLPPLNRALALSMIGRTRVARLLDGWRDQPPVSKEGLAEALVGLSQLAVDFPEVASARTNPLRVGPSGTIALDADLTLRPAGEASRLAIPPYPAELARPFALRDGRRVLVRPIRPEDAEELAAFVRRVPAEDLRFRFFNRLRELPPAQIARLTQIDYDREMAFAALEDGRFAGTARLVLDGQGGGEFAILVDAGWKRGGLASHLMARLVEWARARGLRRMAGQVLAENTGMIRFVRRIGFTTHGTEDPEILEATLDLDSVPAGSPLSEAASRPGAA